MDLTRQRDLHHIGLPTACAEVYAALTGQGPDATRPAEMQLVLNEVAQALAYVIRIYAVDAGSGLPQPIGGFDALQGTFVRGAHAFQPRSGEELKGLTVQRRDMLRAIDVLRSARIRFRVRSAA